MFQTSKGLVNLSFRNIRELRSNFVECEFLEPFFFLIFALCETNLNDSIDSDNFSEKVIFLKSERILLLISVVLQFIWKKDFLSHRTISRKLRVLTYVFNCLYFTQCLNSFFSILADLFRWN